jgi:hypothetical protein
MDETAFAAFGFFVLARLRKKSNQHRVCEAWRRHSHQQCSYFKVQQARVLRPIFNLWFSLLDSDMDTLSTPVML